ncbi:MAG: ATP synthase F1 subunit epsilon [Thermodesulfobacteriota bacterium]
MSEKSFRLIVLTMNQIVFEGDVTSITAPGSMGSFTVLAGHIPLVSTLEKGSVRFRLQDGKEESTTIDGGFLEVKREGEVVVLADNVLSPLQ